jgi:hypothetical protein
MQAKARKQRQIRPGVRFDAQGEGLLPVRPGGCEVSKAKNLYKTV